MATLQKIEELEVWQMAEQLNFKLHPYLPILNETKNEELKNQLDCSADSIMDNIAEGFERDGNREFTKRLCYFGR